MNKQTNTYKRKDVLRISQKSTKSLGSQCFQGVFKEKPFQKSTRLALGSFFSEVHTGKLCKAVMPMIQGGLGSGTAHTNAKLRIVTVMIAW